MHKHTIAINSAARRFQIQLTWDGHYQVINTVTQEVIASSLSGFCSKRMALAELRYARIDCVLSSLFRATDPSIIRNVARCYAERPGDWRKAARDAYRAYA